MQDTITAVDHASQMTDRWLALMMLAILLVAMVILSRYLMAEKEKSDKARSDVTDKLIAHGEKMAEVVANNTAALNEFRKTAERCALKHT